MFPCGHAYYSIGNSENVLSLRVLGSILPDASLTNVFAGPALHDDSSRADFFSTVGNDATFQPLLDGITDHIELDARSHLHWQGDGGYAFALQTPQLRELVGTALGVPDEIARTLAHNIIECACDMLLTRTSEIHATLNSNLRSGDISAAATALARWMPNSNEQVLEQRISSFVDIWRPVRTTTPEMVLLWHELIELLNRSKFGGGIPRCDDTLLTKAIDHAVEIVSDSYLDVLTP